MKNKIFNELIKLWKYFAYGVPYIQEEKSINTKSIKLSTSISTKDSEAMTNEDQNLYIIDDLYKIKEELNYEIEKEIKKNKGNMSIYEINDFFDELLDEEELIKKENYSEKIQKDNKKIKNQQELKMEEIADLFKVLEENKNEIDEFSRYANLVEIKAPEIIKNYSSVPEQHRENLKDRDGLSAKDLCNKGLDEIIDILKLKINEITQAKAEDKMLNLRVTNGFLKEFKSSM